MEPDRLVGRERAIEALLEALASERPILVAGEAGIGKTTLIRSALAGAERRWMEGAGFATLAWMPYVAMRRALGRDVEGDPSRVAEIVEAAVGPDILFIDDVQWLDRESLAVLELLIGRVQIVLASRTEGATDGVGLGRYGALGFEQLRLDPLDDHAAAIVVAARRPQLGRADVERLVAQAGGNPLILEELAAFGSVSLTVARGLRARADALSPEAQRLVRLLAVADRPVPQVTLGPGLDAALASGLVVAHDGLAEVRHAVVASTIRESLDATTLRQLHATLADMIDDPAEAARHLAAAGDAPAAVSRALAGLVSAVGLRERATLLVIAAEASDPAGTEAALDHRLTAARALDALGDWAGVLTMLSVEPVAGAAEQQAEADAIRGHAAFSLGQLDEARAALDRASTWPVSPSGPASARVAWERAALMVNVGGAVAEAIGDLDRALQVRDGSASESDRMLTGLRDSIALLAGAPVDTERIRSALDEALVAQHFTRATDLARVLNVALLMWRGTAPAVQFLVEQAHRFEAAGASDAALDFLAEAVEVHVEDGGFAAAIAAADELVERPIPRRAAQMAAIFRCCALAVLGRLDDAEDGLRVLDGQITDDWFGRGVWLAVRAQVALWNGQPARAAQLVADALAVPSPLVGGHILPRLTVAWAAAELDLPFEGEASPIRSLAGAEPEFDALRCLAAGEPMAAAARFAEAMRLWDGFNAIRAITCRWAEGEALRRAGSDDAVERLTRALEQAEEAGFEAMVVRTRRSLRLAGVRIARPRGGGPALTPQLTARERELLKLVGRGLTNIEIARRMGLGRPTVVRILSNAMTKLGAASRAQAVAMAADVE